MDVATYPWLKHVTIPSKQMHVAWSFWGCMYIVHTIILFNLCSCLLYPTLSNLKNTYFIYRWVFVSPLYHLVITYGNLVLIIPMMICHYTCKYILILNNAIFKYIWWIVFLHDPLLYIFVIIHHYLLKFVKIHDNQMFK